MKTTLKETTNKDVVMYASMYNMCDNEILMQINNIKISISI